MDWHDLEKMKVSDLRELAKDKTELEGLSGLHKEEVVAKLAEAMGISRPHRVVEGTAKAPLKARIRELRIERQAALDAGDPKRLMGVRREIRRLKRRPRRMAHLTH
jgi:hypothetical protein